MTSQSRRSDLGVSCEVSAVFQVAQSYNLVHRGDVSNWSVLFR